MFARLDSTLTMANAADIIARRLHEAGCRYAFGIPGGETLAIMDALAAAGLRFVLTKHENCAGFMAEGVFHATGVPGVMVATLGPGVANAATVIAHAMQDRVPLLVLTGCIDAADALTYTHQIFDHRAMLAPITKASLTAVDGAIDVMIDKALSIALDDQPGPVHVDIPVSVATTPQAVVAGVQRVRPAPVAPAKSPELERAQGYLREATRPLMIAGVDVLHHNAMATVAETVRDFGIPLITTYKAKGILPEDHELCLGAAGWDRHKQVVEFASVANTHYMHQARISFIGHVGAGLEALRAGVKPQSGTWPGSELQATRTALRAAFRPDEDWGPAAVVDTVRHVLPRNGVATVDSGAHRIMLSQVWQCYEARTLLQSNALGAMGSALPLAIGFKLAEPQRPVIAFTGDAGLEMVMGELATLRDLRLPLAIIVFVDEQLGLIELKQRGAGLKNLGVDFGATNFSAVAIALGGHGAWVRNRDALARELKTALGRDTFTIIACAIGRHSYDGRL